MIFPLDFSPHVRRIDPDAEAARLAEQRKRAGPEPFSLDALYSAFADACAKAWDKGLGDRGRPYGVASVTLPEGVLPGLSQLHNPMDKSIVPVVRVPLCTVAEDKS